MTRYISVKLPLFPEKTSISRTRQSASVRNCVYTATQMKTKTGNRPMLLDAKSPPVQTSFGPNLAGILAGNVTIFPPIVSFVSSENAVKSTFRVQLTYTFYSHSIVAGGLLVISYTTRLTCPTSLTIRAEIFCRISQSMRAKSAVMPSTLVIARMAMV